MKKTTKTITTYKFEEGDVICNYMYNWVAVRVANSEEWTHSNGDVLYTRFTDAQVENYLRDETWFYMGNRVERERDKTQVNW